MRFDIHGRFLLEMRREQGRWVAYRLGEGVRRLDPDVQVGSDVEPGELRDALEDVFHEFARPGQGIEMLGAGSARKGRKTLRDIPTPAVLIERPVLERNLKRAAERAEALGVALRPHIKTHRSVELARRQVGLGAQGITCAKPGEAEVFAEADFSDIRLAYPVIGDDKHARLIALDSRSHISFCVDSLEGARQAAAAWERAGRCARVLIKIDCGYGRAGIRWDDEGLGGFAAQLGELAGLKVLGVLTHAGQAYGGAKPGEDPKAVLRSHAALERDRAEQAGAVVASALGQEQPVEVSIGSTPTFWHLETETSASPAPVTEVRPGNYVFHDLTQVALGTAALEDCALSVLATVVSRRERDGMLHLLIDAGKKTLTSDRRVGQSGYGRIFVSPVHVDESTKLVADVEIVALSEEHGWLCAPTDTPWQVGDRLRVAVNHSCVVASTQDRLFEVNGDMQCGEVCVDARGRSS